MSELYIKVENGVVIGDPIFRVNLLQTGLQENDGGGFEGYMPFVRVQAPIPALNQVIGSHEYKIFENDVQDYWNLSPKLKEQYEIDIYIFVEGLLDSFAREKKYKNILSLCSYIKDPNPIYSAEAQFAINLRSSVWNKTYELLNSMADGDIEYAASYEEFKEGLPDILWNDTP